MFSDEMMYYQKLKRFGYENASKSKRFTKSIARAGDNDFLFAPF